VRTSVAEVIRDIVEVYPEKQDSVFQNFCAGLYEKHSRSYTKWIYNKVQFA